MIENLNIDPENIPNHIAVIMDGNGRWAMNAGAEERSFGHERGVQSVRETVEACVDLGVSYLTLYAFSTENWNRPKEEIEALMSILVTSIVSEKPIMMENEIRLNSIGDVELLPPFCQEALQQVIGDTSGNNKMTLTLALSYSGRWDILNAVKKLASDVVKGDMGLDQINEETFGQYLSTSNIPDPELMIRTSGEMRISNFLLWQLAYSELYITNTLWPDFKKEDLFQAVRDYQQRERRFGKTGDQINSILKG